MDKISIFLPNLFKSSLLFQESKMVRVVKRNGRVETLDVSKIQKYTSAAIEGLDSVSQSELEVDAKLKLREMRNT